MNNHPYKLLITNAFTTCNTPIDVLCVNEDVKRYQVTTKNVLIQAMCFNMAKGDLHSTYNTIWKYA